MKEVEVANSVDDLKTSQSVFGRQYPSFEPLDARIITALKKIIQNSNLKRKVHSQEQTAQKEDRFPRGRQIAFIIYENLRVVGTHKTILAFSDLMGELTWRRCAVS